MFGMENEKRKNKPAAWGEFDLEKDLKTRDGLKKTMDQIDKETQKLTLQLRGVESDQYANGKKLLDAFVAVKKVCERVAKRQGG